MSLPIVYHPHYVTPLPPGHRFPMSKFGILHDILLAEGIIQPQQVHQPEVPPQEWLKLIHTPDYIQGYYEGTLDKKVQRRIGLPWSKELVHRTCLAIGGTILTAQLALEHGIACNTAGGTHHAFPDYGSGFCIFNDLAVAAAVMLELELVKQILIVDLDVHQGDGTAFVFQNDPRVFTFSMHCGDNFPSRKQASDLDIPLPIGLDDDGYLQILAKQLPDVLSAVKPDLVLYDAGVDPHVEDRLGKLALSDWGIYRRDRAVLSTCLAAGYPTACVIGGGYSDDLNTLAYRHSLLHRAATAVFE
ncbi:histone deacetylase [Euhalothece natronophila Z-M001]|uniref:Histone deacetylase n=1 Tax=Euhalothece natronophila Z-M001 TaxID=522448 RepID=A0A5B8NS76_9CHRO|nr:histone deacetylase [Euhalothece natronophila]QDZ40890.1 histone deacetylase [Euhalothece natronophila Z-M001]